ASLAGECGFLSANLYARSLFGEDALANLSIEQLEDGSIQGHPKRLERIVITRYAALKHILVLKPYDFPKPPWAAKILQSVVGEGLLTYEGKAHKDLRMYMNKAFSNKHLQAQYELYHGPVQNFIKIIRGEIEKGNGKTRMDMYAWSSRCLLDIIGRAAFGIEIDSLHHDKSPLGTAYHNLVLLQSAENLAGFIFLMNIPFGLGSRTVFWLSSKPWDSDAVASAVKWLTRIGLGILGNELQDMVIFTLAEAKTLGPHALDRGKVDVLSLLISASVQEDSAYKTDAAAVKNSVLTILGAGHETTASGVTWTLWLLASHQDVQNKPRAEVQELLSVYENPPFDKLKELPYLNAVVKESLRVEPPVPATVRQAKYDSVVDGIFIRKGTVIEIPSYVVNTNIYSPWGEDAHECAGSNGGGLTSTNTAAGDGSRDTRTAQLSNLLDYVARIYNRLISTDIDTLHRRLQGQHLAGGDVGHLARTTVNSIVRDVEALGPFPQADGGVAARGVLAAHLLRPAHLLLLRLHLSSSQPAHLLRPRTFAGPRISSSSGCTSSSGRAPPP
ncbi:hypothetical protein OC834_007443, partial [Tilletia horrida]